MGNRNSKALLSKKSVSRMDKDLDVYVKPMKTKVVYNMQCPWCKTDFTFKEEDLTDRVIKCPNCRFEEVFFKHNFINLS